MSATDRVDGPRATGALVDADTELRKLHALLGRYVDGTLGAYEAGAMVRRTAQRLDRACWCVHGVCCGVHQTHVSPHRRCVLR